MKSFVVDLETLGNAPDGVIVDIACLVFDLDELVQNPPKFMDLVNKAKYWKLDTKDQMTKGRIVDKKVVEWWKNQSEAAKQCLVVTGEEIPLFQALDLMQEYLDKSGFDKWKGLGFARGQSWDHTLLVNALQQKYNTRDTFEVEFCKFWNQRDIRSYISGLTLNDSQNMVPLKMGILQGFVKHNAIHDICKDVLMMVYGKRYALGLENPPEADEVDPNTILE